MQHPPDGGGARVLRQRVHLLLRQGGVLPEDVFYVGDGRQNGQDFHPGLRLDLVLNHDVRRVLHGHHEAVVVNQDRDATKALGV